jgi:maleylacetate reductase
MEGFQYQSYAQEILFGSGALQRLRESVERLGWQRVMLCTSPSQRANGHAAAVESIIGGCLVAVFDQVQPHVQDYQVEEAVAIARQNQVQAVIGLGGGSPIGLAKAVAFLLQKPSSGSLPTTSTPARPEAAVIAIPTTYAGSEMTSVYGVTHTDESPPRKVTTSDRRITPKLVLYDPQLTLDLPTTIIASTGLNALAHCIEAIYSVTRNPLSTAAASSAIGYIMNALPVCWTNPADLEARSAMLLGAHLAGLSLASVKMGLHHGLCHVLGGSFNIPHGIANSIILPHAVRFNAEATAPQLLLAAKAMGIVTEGRKPASVIEEMAQRVTDLTRQLDLPQRLRNAGILETDLPGIARLANDNRTVHTNPRPVNSPAEIETLLRDAW